jgi:hypothetical protein
MAQADRQRQLRNFTSHVESWRYWRLPQQPKIWFTSCLRRALLVSGKHTSVHVSCRLGMVSVSHVWQCCLLLCSWRMELAGRLLYVCEQQGPALCLAAASQTAAQPCLAACSSSRCSRCQDTCTAGQGNCCGALAAQHPARSSPGRAPQHSCRAADHSLYAAPASQGALRVGRKGPLPGDCGGSQAVRRR